MNQFAAHIGCPYTVEPPHKVTTSEILEEISRNNPHHTHLDKIKEHIGNLRVDTRYFMRPLDDPTVSGNAPVEERNRVARETSRELAVAAAHGAIEKAGLTAGDIDAVVTSHTTSWQCPGLDVQLVNDLDLRPDIERTALNTSGCGGGAHALINAVHYVANPLLRVNNVLVVVSEQLSTIYHQEERDIRHQVYKALFGDGAIGVVVSGEQRGPGIGIDVPPLTYMLRHTEDWYFGFLGADGLHFESSPKSLKGTREFAPRLRQYMNESGVGLPPDWAVVHPGGPKIIQDVGEALDLDCESALTHSWTSLREHGNRGGAAVLDTLAYTHASPPAHGGRGIILGYGPGHTADTLAGTWLNH